MLDSLKTKEKKQAKAIRPMRAEKRDFGWSKVKVSGLHLLWLDVKSVEGRKEGKDEEINREAIQPMKMEKEVKSQSVRTRCSVEELCEWEQAKEKRKIEKIHGEEESSEWKEKESFFFTQVKVL